MVTKSFSFSNYCNNAEKQDLSDTSNYNNAEKQNLSHTGTSLGQLNPKVVLQKEIFATISPSHQEERFVHSMSTEEAGPPPAYASQDELCIGITSSSATSSVTDIRSRISSDPSSFHHLRAPHLSNTQRQMTYPPIANESPTLLIPTTAQPNSIEPAELSNTGNFVPGDN
ncbi:PREDICTED: uncharacterized protein LOC109592594 [Amphimedon queenslandica]|uniref:Uncharacterized protein n=2 Tax=Amphimedon queenslandica TaxID=400682 RepID=A0AAN0K344_AMPQE|nr:PREDICTED: uncharacterized protein LOC109592594 [Amphimedon queenslandica]|eukprot:XP_019863567.1 PREDICTED: uncharacterized protein LOC109592594 [Amphimedon queenslandica]